MLSSSASWSTRSLKSSHDNSRFAYSSVESSATSVTSAKRVLLLSTQGNREVLRFPGSDELPVEHVAPRPQIDDQRLEAAVEQPVGRVAHGLGVEILGGRSGRFAHGGGVLEPQPLDVALDARDHDVAVVDLAEQVLQLLGALGRLLGRLAQHRLVELQHIAKPLCRNSHVVEGVDVRGVEYVGREGAQLAGAPLHDSSHVLEEVPLGVEALDLARLHAAAASAWSRPRRSLSSISWSAAASASLA